MVFLRSIAGMSLSEFKFTPLNLRAMGIENSYLALRRQIAKTQRERKREILVGALRLTSSLTNSV